MGSELTRFGINISSNIVSRVLEAHGYNKQNNLKIYQNIKGHQG